MKDHFVPRGNDVVDVRNGGYNIGSCICGRCGKPIYVKIRSNALFGGQTNPVKVEGDLRYEVAHRQQIYNHKNLLDTDWARDVRNPRSTSTYILSFGKKTISWNNKLQQTVTQSSIEMENNGNEPMYKDGYEPNINAHTSG